MYVLYIYSNSSPKCTKFEQFMNATGFKFNNKICIDTVSARQQLKSSGINNLKEVPALVVSDAQGNAGLHQGSNAVMFVKKFRQQQPQQQQPQQQQPQQQMQKPMPQISQQQIMPGQSMQRSAAGNRPDIGNSEIYDDHAEERDYMYIDLDPADFQNASPDRR